MFPLTRDLATGCAQYSKECGIAQLMVGKIRAYFRQLGLSDEEAADLHNQLSRSVR